MQPRTRLLIALVLVGALAGLGVFDASTEADRWPYPQPEAIDEDFDRHVGDRVLLFGSVDEVDGDGATLRVSHDRGSFELSAEPFGSAIEDGERIRPGGTVQVLGTLESDREIAVDAVVVVNPTRSSEYIKYGLSLVGVGLFLVVFFSRWRVNLRKLRVEARSDG